MTLLERIRKYGRNSNSFLTLYDGFKHFESPAHEGSVAYVETRRSWVAATEPLAPEASMLGLLEEFSSQAQAHGRRMMMLPVSEEFASLAKKKGFKTLMIGSEPTFELERFIPSFEKFHSAKHLHNAGARVEVFQYNEMSPELRAECQEILNDWLEMRWMAPLSFLNRVNPWEQAEHKTFFLLRHNGRCLAFLAAIPVWPNKGWYFVDLLRRKDSPPGTTETLLMEAMRLVKAAGSAWVSLGLSPLSRLEEAPEGDDKKLYSLLKLVYERGNSFYRFKPLYEFKAKLGPTSYPKRYLIFSSRKIGVRDVLSLMHVLVPGGILEMAWSGIRKKIQVERVFLWIGPKIRPDVVTRALPQNTLSFVQRIRLSFSVALLSIAGYLVSSPLVKKQFRFSWENLVANPVSAILMSPWLHSNTGHLIFNLFSIATFVACLELLVGTRTTARIFILGALVSNPITLALLRPILHEAHWYELNDIGISLGTFACMGALGYLLRFRRKFIVIAHIGIIIAALIKQDWMAMNHLTALWVGILRMRYMLKDWKISVPWKPKLGSLALLGSVGLLLGSKTASADGWVFLPENNYQQYQTYAFFQEEQTGLLFTNGGRAWGLVGGNVALLENGSSSWHPQVIAFASGDFSYRMNGLGVLTDTFDARVGARVDFEPAEGHRISVSWTHYSGHISDDVQDKDLIGPNLGWEQIGVRYLYCRPENFRIGMTIKPFYSWDPSVKPWASDQFAEWYPIGLSSDRRKPSPYLAAGLEQYGIDSIRLTEQVQAGVLFGNHSRPAHEQSLRLAAGYYNGIDPRLKYAAFKRSTSQFGYLGFLVDL